MSLFEAIVKKKKELKTCDTIVTSSAGCKYLETRNSSGELESKKLSENSTGFVVDEKLDLQIAEIYDFLYLSSQDPSQDEDLLKTKGITHVISVGVDLPLYAKFSKINFMKVKLLDEPGANIKEVFTQCFNFINDARKENTKNKILVHCNAGYSRAPTIVISYLMKELGYSLSEAFEIVKSKRNIKPNEGFMKQLKEFETELKNKGKSSDFTSQ